MSDSKIKIFHTDFDNLTRKQTCDKIELLIKKKDRLYIVAVKDVAIVVKSIENKFLLDFYNNVDLLAVDGRGLVYTSYIICRGKNGFKEMVGGPGIYYEILKRSTSRKYKLFYFGAKKDVLEKAINNIRQRLPDLHICGYHHGYLNEANVDNFFINLNKCPPDVIFVGISSPIREKIIEKYRNCFPNCVCIFIGGMIDVEAGIASIAPKLISYLGIEWLWRVIHEPSRLAKGYLYTHSKFIYYFFQELYKQN